jgi:hypothetical protein
MRSAARRKREHLRARQGHVGGGLARRWERADHAMTAVGRDGVDATDADVVVLAVPSGQIADALGKVGGLAGRRWRLRRCSTARRIRAGLSDLVTSVVTGSSWPGQLPVGSWRHPGRGSAMPRQPASATQADRRR